MYHMLFILGAGNSAMNKTGSGLALRNLHSTQRRQRNKNAHSMTDSDGGQEKINQVKESRWHTEWAGWSSSYGAVRESL